MIHGSSLIDLVVTISISFHCMGNARGFFGFGLDQLSRGSSPLTLLQLFCSIDFVID